MRVTLTKVQYRAINDLRGLPEGAHMMVMCSESTATGGVLEGSKEDFDELVSFVGESLADGLVAAGDVRALRSACVKIDPKCQTWLGL